MAYVFPLLNKGHAKYTALYVEDLNYVMHVQKTLELLVCTEGSFYVHIANNNYSLKAGACCLIMDNIPHAYLTPKNGHSKALVITLYEDDLNLICKHNNSGFQKSIVLYDEGFKNDILSISDKIINLATDESDYLLVFGLSLAILSIMSNSLYKEYVNVNKESITLNYILQYATENVFKQFSLEKMSSDLGISKFYLSRLFSNEVCINYKRYLNALRMSGAKRLLIQTNNPIGEIANECAFESVRTFNREFTKYFGLSPTNFRKTKSNLRTIDVNSPYELCLEEFRKLNKNTQNSMSNK